MLLSKNYQNMVAVQEYKKKEVSSLVIVIYVHPTLIHLSFFGKTILP